jgi:hypothetical protein
VNGKMSKEMDAWIDPFIGGFRHSAINHGILCEWREVKWVKTMSLFPVIQPRKRE